MENKTITAYKGFDKDLKCRDFQYEVGKTYEIDGKIEPCERGFHACEYPFDCFNYYDPANSRFCEVEQSGNIIKDDDKTVSSRIKIIRELTLAEMINIAIEKSNDVATNSGNCSVANNSGNCSVANNSGDCSVANNSGNCSVANNSGDRSVANNSGDCSVANNSGYRSVATNSGNCSVANNSGNCSVANNSGDCSVANNSGYSSVANNSGDRSVATNSGDCSVATNSGYRSVATNSGYRSVALNWGVESKAKASKGSYIALAEWVSGLDNSEYVLKGAKMRKVDGKNIKADTYYMLVDNKFVEVE